MTRERSYWYGIGAIVLTMLIYAANFVATRYGVQNGLSPHDLVALRYAIAGVLLLPYFVRLGLVDLGGLGWPKALLLTCIAGAPYLLVFVQGLSMAPAAHGAVLNPGVVPSVVFLITVTCGMQRFSLSRAVSLVLIITGLALVTAASFSGDRQVLVGDVLLFLTGWSWGIFTLLTRVWSLRPMQSAAVISVISMAYLPIYAVFFYQGFADVTWLHLGAQAVYQGVFNSVITLYLITFAIQRLGAQLTSLFSPSVPILATLLAVPLLGEVPSMIQWAGIGVVVVGMIWAAKAA